MVSVISKLAVCAAVMVTVGSALEVGEYSRPSGAEVSGVMGATTPFVRAPCPALNTLANHGYLPRDGKKITREMLQAALVTVFNIDPLVAKGLAIIVPENASLSDLSKPVDLEHDVSLVHADSVYGNDPSAVNMTMWEDLASRAEGDYLTVKSIAGTRGARIDLCKTRKEGCTYRAQQRIIGSLESAILLRVMGGKNDERISLEDAKSFLVDERFPESYEKPETVVTLSKAIVTGVKIDTSVTWSDILEFFGL